VHNTPLCVQNPWSDDTCSGQKHPSLQGTDPKYGFAEIWDQFAQLLEGARQTGNTVEEKNSFLLLERHGFLEETYFSWKFMPMVGPEGYTIGSYATVVESTEEVIAARRLATIQHLGQVIASSLPYHGHWGTILTGLNGSRNDIPLALLYSVADRRATPPLTPRDVLGSDGSYCYLEGTLGVGKDHPIAPRLVDITRDSKFGWASAFRRSMDSNDAYLVLDVGSELLPAPLLDGIPWRGFDIPSRQIVVCPIRSPTTATVLSFLVIALNPRRPYDKAYEDWIELLIKSIATPHVEAVTAAADSAQLSKRLLVQTKNLRESEKKFLHFARRSTVGILILDPEGNLLFGNSAWFELIMAKASTRDQYNDAIHPDDLALRNSKWAEMLRERVPVNYQLRFNKPWKPPRSLGIGAAETCTFTLIFMWPDLDSDGNIQSVMATATDISEIKFIEDQLRQKSLDAEQRVKQQEVRQSPYTYVPPVRLPQS
jgi:PAS domain-containing protein